MNFSKKIHDNAQKVKLSAIIALGILIIYRIYIIYEQGSFVKLWHGEGSLFSSPIVLGVITILEMIAVFLKNSAATAVSIINSVVIIPHILIEVPTTVFGLYASTKPETGFHDRRTSETSSHQS